MGTRKIEKNPETKFFDGAMPIIAMVEDDDFRSFMITAFAAKKNFDSAREQYTREMEDLCKLHKKLEGEWVVTRSLFVMWALEGLKELFSLAGIEYEE